MRVCARICCHITVFQGFQKAEKPVEWNQFLHTDILRRVVPDTVRITDTK
jgi:hypothetical protein